MTNLLARLASIGLIIFPVLLSGAESSNSTGYAGLTVKKDPSKILMEIYKEVKELGKFPGDDFIKREFFVGKDDDDTYQNIHVCILIQNIDEIEKITIQVTYFSASENDPTVKYANNMRSISYALLKDESVIIKSDYNEKERKKFLPKILRAIRGKKKLLKKEKT
jgi:hypothetical protein